MTAAIASSWRYQIIAWSGPPPPRITLPTTVRAYRLLQCLTDMSMSSSGPPAFYGLPWVRAAALGISLALVGLAVWRGWQELQDYSLALSPGPLVAAGVLLLFQAPALGLGWWAILRAMGGQLSLRHGLRIFFVSNTGKYLPGRVWHLAGRLYLAQQGGLTAQQAAGSIALEAVLYLGVGLCLALVSFPVALSGWPAYSLAGVVAVAVLTMLLLPRKSFWKIMPALPSSGGQRPLHCPQLAGTRSILVLVATYTGIWGTIAMSLFLVASSAHPVQATALPAMGGVYATSYLLGLAAPVLPNGLGVREVSMAALLSTMVPLPAAITASALYRLLQAVFDLMWAAIGLRM